MTAIICKTKKGFNKIANLYLDPVFINDFCDIGSYKFIRVIKGQHFDRVLNHNRLYAKCLERCIVVVGVITDQRKEFNKWQKKNQSLKGVMLYSVKLAEDYYYSDIVLLRSTKFFVEAVDIMCMCEARYINS